MASETRLFGRWLKETLGAHGVKSAAQVGEFYGMSNVSGHRITKEDVNPSVSRAIDYIEPLGYALAIVPKGSELPSGGVYLAKVRDTGKCHGKGGINE